MIFPKNHLIKNIKELKVPEKERINYNCGKNIISS